MDYNKILMDSAEKGGLGGVISALKHGADVNLRNKNGNTALILASCHGHTETVKMLIDAGADLDIQDRDDWTALTWAAIYGHTELVQILIDSKTVLDIAIENSHHDIVRLIISHLEKLSERQNQYIFDLNI